MTVEIFCVCEAADHLPGGALNIRNTFGKLVVPQVPVQLSHLAVAARIRFDLAEEGSHQLMLSVIDIDGKPLGPPAEQLLTVSATGNEIYAWATATFVLQGFRIAAPVEIRFDLSIRGQCIASSYLYVTVG